jgi:hypothetical protein
LDERQALESLPERWRAALKKGKIVVEEVKVNSQVIHSIALKKKMTTIY